MIKVKVSSLIQPHSLYFQLCNFISQRLQKELYWLSNGERNVAFGVI